MDRFFVFDPQGISSFRPRPPPPIIHRFFDSEGEFFIWDPSISVESQTRRAMLLHYPRRRYSGIGMLARYGNFPRYDPETSHPSPALYGDKPPFPIVGDPVHDKNFSGGLRFFLD